MGKIGGLALVAVMALTGCSATPQQVAQAEVTPVAQPTATSRVVQVKAKLSVMGSAPDATIQAMADSVCKLYASGKSSVEVTALVIASSAALRIGDDGLKVANAAVKDECPQFG